MREPPSAAHFSTFPCKQKQSKKAKKEKKKRKEINLVIMKYIIIKTFILKSKACSYSLPRYKIKPSIVSVKFFEVNALKSNLLA